MINSVTIAGNVVRDAESRSVKTSSKRNNVMKFTVAVNGYSNDDVNFIDVEMWCTDNQRGFFLPRLKKGAQVAVQGSLKQSRWESNGQNHSRVLVNANDIFIPRSKKTDEMSEEVIEISSDDLYDEDIPF